MPLEAFVHNQSLLWAKNSNHMLFNHVYILNASFPENYTYQSEVGGGDPGDHNRVVGVLKFFAHIYIVYSNRFPTTNFEFPILTAGVHV